MADETILEVGAFVIGMNVRDNPSLTANKIGITFPGDVMVVTGESSGSLAEKFLAGRIYHDDQVLTGWVKKYYDTDADNALEYVLTHLNIPGISYAPPAEVTVEQAFRIIRDWVNKIP